MKTKSEVWDEYNRLQTILKSNIDQEIYDDELSDMSGEIQIENGIENGSK